MASKRSANQYDSRSKKLKNKHTLDSDEELSEDETHLDSDIEGEEDGASRMEGGTRMTAFNLREEQDDGHFDKDGNFIWKKEKEIRDNWVDSVDWENINNNYGGKKQAESSDDEVTTFDESENYKHILKYLTPGETVRKAISRLGGGTKLSSIERLRLKKMGKLPSKEDVTRLTELANKNLTELGNMDIYDETYEDILKKVQPKSEAMSSSYDMFADEVPSSSTNIKKPLQSDLPSTSSEQELPSSSTNVDSSNGAEEQPMEGCDTTNNC